MSEEQIRALFAEQQELLQRRLDAAVEAITEPSAESNRIAREGEERNKAADELHRKRALEHDRRAEEDRKRYERQTVAWERIADALTKLSKAVR